MVKAIVGILPWAVVLVAIGAAIWWLLSRDMAAGRWLLAGLLIGHGVVHVMFAIPAPAATAGGSEWPFDMARSWVVTGAGLDLSMVRAVGLALIAVVVGAFGLAALSTAGIVVPSSLWPAISAVGAIASAVLLVLFLEPQLVLGLGIDAVLIGVVATRAWSP
jgi:hypothetical protein